MSKRIEELSETQSSLCGVVPYIDPKSFRNNNDQIQIYSLNEKSDVYSVGVLFWEISSGYPPFNTSSYDVNLALQILQGRREAIIPGTPNGYANLYTGK